MQDLTPQKVLARIDALSGDAVALLQELVRPARAGLGGQVLGLGGQVLHYNMASDYDGLMC